MEENNVKSPFFTVFTSTFNRAHLLERVYQSLQEQTDRDFEWIIVDDGSIDGTKELVKQWTEKAPFPIRCFYQENSGKHVSINRGVAFAQGFMFVTVDSDDWLTPRALERIRATWESISKERQEQFAGVAGLCAYSSGKVVGTSFPQNVIDSNAIEIRVKYCVKGDKVEAYRVKVLKEYPFPENLGRFVPEGLVWNRIAKKYLLRFFNEILIYKEYQPDGLTAKGLLLLTCSPQSIRLYYQEFLEWHKRSFIPLSQRIKLCSLYVRSSFHSKTPITKQLKEVPFKGLWLISYPIGLLLWLRDCRRMKYEP